MSDAVSQPLMVPIGALLSNAECYGFFKNENELFKVLPPNTTALYWAVVNADGLDRYLWNNEKKAWIPWTQCVFATFETKEEIYKKALEDIVWNCENDLGRQVLEIAEKALKS